MDSSWERWSQAKSSSWRVAGDVGGSQSDLGPLRARRPGHGVTKLSPIPTGLPGLARIVRKAGVASFRAQQSRAAAGVERPVPAAADTRFRKTRDPTQSVPDVQLAKSSGR